MALKKTFHDKKKNNDGSLVIFVHGLGAPKTFADWPKKIQNDHRLSKLDMIIVEYDTGHFCLPSPFGLFQGRGFNILSKRVVWGTVTSIDTLARELAREIEENPSTSHYNKIVLVGHSMGGLISMWYFLEALKRKKAENIKGYISIATPFNGSGVAALVKLISKHKQIPELAPNSSFLGNMQRAWLGCKEDKTISKKMLDVNFNFFYASNDEAVNAESAIPSFAVSDRWTATPLAGTHSSVVNLNEDGQCSYEYIKSKIMYSGLATLFWTNFQRSDCLNSTGLL